MAIFLRCFIDAEDCIDVELKFGVFAFRFKLWFSKDHVTIETKHAKRTLGYGSEVDGGRAYGIVNGVLHSGLPSEGAVRFMSFNLRYSGVSRSLNSYFIIEFGINKNTLRANSYVIKSENQNIAQYGLLKTYFESSLKIKLSSIITYSIRILSRR